MAKIKDDNFNSDGSVNQDKLKPVQKVTKLDADNFQVDTTQSALVNKSALKDEIKVLAQAITDAKKLSGIDVLEAQLQTKKDFFDTLK